MWDFFSMLVATWMYLNRLKNVIAGYCAEPAPVQSPPDKNTLKVFSKRELQIHLSELEPVLGLSWREGISAKLAPRHSQSTAFGNDRHHSGASVLLKIRESSW